LGGYREKIHQHGEIIYFKLFIQFPNEFWFKVLAKAFAIIQGKPHIIGAMNGSFPTCSISYKN
jgi:hypothetical protein